MREDEGSMSGVSSPSATSSSVWVTASVASVVWVPILCCDPEGRIMTTAGSVAALFSFSSKGSSSTLSANDTRGEDRLTFRMIDRFDERDFILVRLGKDWDRESVDGTLSKLESAF